MSYPVFYVPAGDVLPVMFPSYAGSTGASVTLTGLAVTDIEIYKDGSTTQRSSDAGYTLLDTDGIDFDTITGIHGFSIDTGDNTDAGFYTVGAWFTVVVSAVTIDSQTVNFIACQFRLMAAEGVAGVPDVNTTHVADTAQTGRDLGASVLLSSGTGAGQISLSSGLVTLAGVTHTGAVIPTVTTTTTATNLTNLPAITANWLTAAGIAAGALDGKGNWNIGKTGYTLTATTGLGNQTADITGSLSGSVGSVTGAVGSVTGAVGSVTGAVGSLAAQAKADVNAEVVDALSTDTYAEPGQGAPAATTTLAAKINYLYKFLRNKVTTTSTTVSVYDDAGTTVDQKSTISDDGTTFTRGEYGTGP